MVGCDLTYGLESDTGAGNASIVENFLPSYRTFKIFPLRSNSSYWLYMTCKDRTGGWHVSDTTSFTTGVAMMVRDQPEAVQDSQVSQAGLVETLNRGMLSVRPTKSISPHILMGKSYIQSPTARVHREVRDPISRAEVRQPDSSDSDCTDCQLLNLFCNNDEFGQSKSFHLLDHSVNFNSRNS